MNRRKISRNMTGLMETNSFPGLCLTECLQDIKPSMNLISMDADYSFNQETD